MGLTLFAMMLAVGGRPEDHEVRLTNVHARFVEALRARSADGQV